MQEKAIPKVKKKNSKKYLWIGLGTLLVGGTAIALAGGDSGGESDSGGFTTKW